MLFLVDLEKLVMKSFVILALLSVVLIFEVGDAFAGGEQYQNRANAYWLQIYLTIATAIGIVTTIIVLTYKFKKRRITQ
jgi:ABC-type arginine transport system permease subunit